MTHKAIIGVAKHQKPLLIFMLCLDDKKVERKKVKGIFF
jgi:hypothetical protein